MIVYKTDSMEEALTSLSRRFQHVVAKVHYNTERRIPLRGNRVDARQCLYRPWDPVSAGLQLSLWRERGGVLLDHGRSYKPSVDAIGARDATFFVEVPLTFFRYECGMRGTRHEVVLYQPPTWEQHERACLRTSPVRSTCALVAGYLEARIAAGLAPHERSYVHLMGLDHEAPQAFVSDFDLRTMVEGASDREALAVRSLIYRCATLSRPVAVYEVELRYPPVGGPLRVLYDWLDDRRIAKYPVVMVRANHLNEAFDFHRAALRELARTGAVAVRSGRLFTQAAVDDLVYEKADFERRTALNEFRVMRDFVGAAPWYPYIDDLVE